MNKYTKWYTSITNNAKQRNLDCYTEIHHIEPRSLGGLDTPENLVKLTPREHFVCHWLLVKMTTGLDHHKMLNALRMMRAEKQGQQRYNTKITARVYAGIKEEYALLQSKRFTGENNPNYGNKWTTEQKEEQRKKLLGRKQTQEALDNLQVALLERKVNGLKRKGYSDEYKEERSKKYTGAGNPNYNKKHKESSLELMRQKATGRKQSEETIRKKIEATTGKKRKKLLCPHCSQHIAVNGYARFHGDKCKQNPNPKKDAQ
jgi:hypothetical protein